MWYGGGFLRNECIATAHSVQTATIGKELREVPNIRSSHCVRSVDAAKRATGGTQKIYNCGYLWYAARAR